MTEERKMKDSGIEWIGEIPEDWDKLRIQFVCDQVKTPNTQLEDKTALKFKYGTIEAKPDWDPDTDNYVNQTMRTYTRVEPGMFVINPLNLNFDLISLRTAISRLYGAITSAYLVFKLKETAPLTEDYMIYLLKGYDAVHAFHNMGSGVRQSLNWTELSKNYVLVPPLSEQRAISKYLDEVLGKVDEAIALKNEQLEQLAAYKKSLISECVCRGVPDDTTQDVVMKDSGIEWIGKTPEHWKIKRGKFFLKQIRRPICNDDDDIVTCFRDGEVTLRKNRRTEGFTMADKENGYQGIEPGDLVVHGMDGFAGAIGISDSRGKSTPVYIVLETDQDKKYLMYFLRGLAYKNIFVALSTGIRERSCDLKYYKLADILYTLPPLNEQRAIATYLDDKSEKIEQTSNAITDEIETLEQYKKALIWEYVTGKKRIAYL